MTLRLAILVSHPIQHFAPLHREIAKQKGVDLRVYFYCDWGVESYVDPDFQVRVKWDIPLLDGYAHEFLPISRRPERLRFWQIDNPGVVAALDMFNPDVVQVFGYAYRTNWRIAAWTRQKRRPLLMYSDADGLGHVPFWKRLPREALVRYFYGHVDGALFVSENNYACHIRYGVPPERLFKAVLPIDRQHLLQRVNDRAAAHREVRQRHGIPIDAFVVLFCGKFVSHKRPLDLVVAAWEANKKGFPVWSLLVGDGPERSAIEEFCRREGVDNTVLAGFVNQSRICDYYVASDVLAVTSSRDNHPLVVGEGSSFGLPVIISNRVGCIGKNDVARPGFNALVYHCGDLHGLQGHIENLYLERRLYRGMSEAAIQVSKGQDASIAAKALTAAAHELHKIGPR